MSKYVIEIEEKPLCVFDKDTQTFFPRLWRVKGFNSLVLDEEGLSRLEELNSDYINEHFSDLQDDAYNKGYAQCQDDYSDALKHAKDTAYKKGLEDGKAVNDKGCEGCKYGGSPQGDSPCYNCSNYYKNNWMAKDDKIEVGDTVNLKDGSRDNDGIVTKSWDNDRHFIMWADGSGGVWDKEYIVKTGRHFDIASILEDMRHD